jgi:hypothetical protein
VVPKVVFTVPTEVFVDAVLVAIVDEFVSVIDEIVHGKFPLDNVISDPALSKSLT